ncbi:hypothetical protein rsdtw13_32270 [Clostridium sp. TW13]|uniref:Uncharacterized protein n=1 Tax=Inconstantimicrobium mannanitabidum TaxID=1604901 RepID=A0ACB5RFV5_9CLOT|nr:hypothetical protein rsdtw13_32270 [Clostridium sp. TW13]
MINFDKLLKYMFFCHRLPERSFFYKGRQFPICARCTGILVGYLLGIIYILSFKTLHIVIEFSLMVPLLIDGTGQYLGYFTSTNSRRFITGILAGISTICLFRLAGVLGLESGHAFYHLIAK